MRNIPTELEIALESGRVHPSWMFEFDHPKGWMGLWGGVGRLFYEGQPFDGSGIVLTMTAPEQSLEAEVQRLSLTLSRVKMSKDQEELVLFPVNQFPVRYFTIFLDEKLRVIGRRFEDFRGQGDTPIVTFDGEGGKTYQMNVEGVIYNMTRPNGVLMSHQEQQAIYPGDTGLIDASKYESPSAVWAPGPYNNFTPPSS